MNTHLQEGSPCERGLCEIKAVQQQVFQVLLQPLLAGCGLCNPGCPRPSSNAECERSRPPRIHHLASISYVEA